MLAIGANLVWPAAPRWFVDASVLSAILFFLFFIAQARKAMAPYEQAAGQPTIAEAVADWLLPAVFCAAGALVLGATLLPLLTVPAALVIGAGQRGRLVPLVRAVRRLLFQPVLPGAISGGALMLQR